jgi:26S proteasome regulatory subunit N5
VQGNKATNVSIDEKEKLALLVTLHEVTEGKVYVESEHAKVTRLLANLKESSGLIQEAADLMFDLQVETYGSMDLVEKMDYILDQMRLSIAIRDFSQTQIISKRIQPKHFKSDSSADLQSKKLDYYRMMVQLALNDQDYLQCAQHFYNIYDTDSIQQSPPELQSVVQKMMFFTMLAPHTNEQVDLKNRLYNQCKPIQELFEKKDTPKSLNLHKAFLKSFLTQEIMRWPVIEAAYCPTLNETVISLNCGSLLSESLWVPILKDRVMEHNLRVISKYYQRITMTRLSVILDTDIPTTEQLIGKMVVDGIIYGRLDRPAGIVTFTPKKDPEQVLAEWADRMQKLLDLVVKANHLIAREDIVRSVLL